MPTDQQIATEFAQGFAAFSRAVDMVLKIGNVQDAHETALKALADARAKTDAALAALDKAKADADKISADASSSANATIADAKANAASIIADAKAKADKALNDAVAEASRQKADLDHQIADARAVLAGLTSKPAQ